MLAGPRIGSQFDRGRGVELTCNWKIFLRVEDTARPRGSIEDRRGCRQSCRGVDVCVQFLLVVFKALKFDLQGLELVLLITLCHLQLSVVLDRLCTSA